MSCILINPPEVQNRVIPLAVAMLAATLRQRGVQVMVDDLNMALAEQVLTRRSCLEAKSTLEKGRRSIENADYLLLAADQCADKVEWAKDKLNDWGEAFSYDEYRLAQSLIERAGEMFYSSHGDYAEWLGTYEEYESLNEMCETAKRPPRVALEFLEKRADEYSKFYEGNTDKRLMGLTVRCAEQLIWSLAIACFMKERIADLHVTLGGSFLSFYTASYEKFGRLFESVDSVVVCDGESAICDIHEAVSGGRLFTECRNTVTLQNGSPHLQMPIHFEDLEALPPPDFDDLPIRKYFSNGAILPMAITRGCPFRCAFCNYNTNYSNRYRQESVESVVAKVKKLKERYGTSYFYWAVSVLTPNYMEALSKELLKEDADIRWFCQAKVDRRYTKETCGLMYDSGARVLGLGIESGCDRILGLVEKGFKREDVAANLKMFDDAGIGLGIFVIGDLPTETIGEWQQTLDLLRKNEDRIVAAYAQKYQLAENSPIWMEPEKYDVRFEVSEAADDIYFIPQYKGEEYLGVSSEGSFAKLEMLSEYAESTTMYYQWVDDVLWLTRYGMPYMSDEQFIFMATGEGVPANPYEKNKDGEWEFNDDEEMASYEVDRGCASESTRTYLFNKITGETLELDENGVKIVALLRNVSSTVDGMIDHVCKGLHRDDPEFKGHLKNMIKDLIYRGFIRASA